MEMMLFGFVVFVIFCAIGVAWPTFFWIWGGLVAVSIVLGLIEDSRGPYKNF